MICLIGLLLCGRYFWKAWKLCKYLRSANL